MKEIDDRIVFIRSVTNFSRDHTQRLILNSTMFIEVDFYTHGRFKRHKFQRTTQYTPHINDKSRKLSFPIRVPYE